MGSQRIYRFAPSVPAGTLASAPVTVPMEFPPARVTALRLHIPPGPHGVMGFRIAAAGTQIVPVNVGQWMIGDDEIYELSDLIAPDAGAWEFVGYNTGLYPHLVNVTFVTVPAAAVVGAFPQPVPV